MPTLAELHVDVANNDAVLRLHYVLWDDPLRDTQ